jgi:hypothetical protein
VAERVAELAIAIAPGLVLKGHIDLGAGFPRSVPPKIGVIDLENETDGAGLFVGGPELREGIGEHHISAIDAEMAMRDPLSILVEMALDHFRGEGTFIEIHRCLAAPYGQIGNYPGTRLRGHCYLLHHQILPGI